MLVLMFILEVDLILDQIPWMTCQLERGEGRGGGTEGVFRPLLELIYPPPPALSFSNLLSLSLMWIWHWIFP